MVDSSSLIGRTISRYRIIEKPGGGGTHTSCRFDMFEIRGPSLVLFFWMPPPDGEGWEWHDGRHIQLLDGVAVWE